MTTLRRDGASVPAVTVLGRDFVEVSIGDITQTPLAQCRVTLVDADERFATRTETHVQSRTHNAERGSSSSIDVATLCTVPKSI